MKSTREEGNHIYGIYGESAYPMTASRMGTSHKNGPDLSLTKSDIQTGCRLHWINYEVAQKSYSLDPIKTVLRTVSNSNTKCSEFQIKNVFTG